MNRSIVTFSTAAMISIIAAPAALGQATERHIFICNNGNNEGSVSSMKVAGDGTLSFVDKYITGINPDPGTNAQCISLTPNGQYLCTGHGTISNTNEQLTFIEVHADGTLTQAGEFLTPDSPLDVQWLDDEYIAVVRTDSPSFVLVYQFNPAGPTLSAIDTDGSGSFNTWLVFDAAHNLLYSQSSTGSTVNSFRFNPGAGTSTLTLIEALSSGGTYPLGIGLSPDGARLYGGGGISGNDHLIMGMDINTATGDLTNMSGSPFNSPGTAPKQVVVTTDGRFAIAAHGTDATIRSFEVDQGTGTLTSTGFSYDIGGQGDLGEVAVMKNPSARGPADGDFVFATDRTTSGDGVAGVRSFTLGSDGSFSENGTIVNTQGIAAYSISPWDPPALFCATDLTDSVSGGPDGEVNVFDLLVLLGNWNTAGPGAAIAPPTNVVDVFDLFVLLAEWGPCVP